MLSVIVLLGVFVMWISVVVKLLSVRGLLTNFTVILCFVCSPVFVQQTALVTVTYICVENDSKIEPKHVTIIRSRAEVDDLGAARSEPSLDVLPFVRVTIGDADRVVHELVRDGAEEGARRGILHCCGHDHRSVTNQGVERRWRARPQSDRPTVR